jgi:hypothetical protein
MGLSEEARARLADIVELQPTKNADLQERWGVESGSEVHQYLEAELRDYYYRDEDSMIRATAAATALVSDLVDTSDVEETVRVTDLEATVLEVLAGPDERSQSVVSVLHAVRERTDADPSVEAVRRALQRLKRKGVVETEHRTVPTFRLAAPRAELALEVSS